MEVYPNCQSRKIRPEFLELLSEKWTAVFLQLKTIGVGEIQGLDELEVSLLDDEEMARLHGEFLDDATTTDVITFAHGELLIGVETAERQAGFFASSWQCEIALYGIHGMLHLAGFDDRSPAEAALMKARQESLLREFFGEAW